MANEEAVVDERTLADEDTMTDFDVERMTEYFDIEDGKEADEVADDGTPEEMDTPEAEPDAEAAEDDEVADEGDDEGEPEGEPEPESYRVKVDGEYVDVTLEDLQRSYSSMAANTRKAQENALREQQLEARELLLADGGYAPPMPGQYPPPPQTQAAPPQQGPTPPPDLDMADPVTRQMYEQMRAMQEELQSFKSSQVERERRAMAERARSQVVGATEQFMSEKGIGRDDAAKVVAAMNKRGMLVNRENLDFMWDAINRPDPEAIRKETAAELAKKRKARERAALESAAAPPSGKKEFTPPDLDDPAFTDIVANDPEIFGG